VNINQQYRLHNSERFSRIYELRPVVRVSRAVHIARSSSVVPRNLGTDSTTIAVIAQHGLVRSGLVRLLEMNPGFRITAELPDVAALLRITAASGGSAPDVLLLADAVSSAEVRELAAALPNTCLLCLSDHAPRGHAAKVVTVPGDADVDQLCLVLDAALDGRCAGCAFRTVCRARSVAAALTPRERQVACCVAEGMSSKQIAASLGISVRTVNTYRERLAKKVGGSSAAVVTRFVLEQGLFEMRTA
jgi:DNA-binding NarL/FixJ family response regulator